jgi:hypothetical protein
MDIRYHMNRLGLTIYLGIIGWLAMEARRRGNIMAAIDRLDEYDGLQRLHGPDRAFNENTRHLAQGAFQPEDRRVRVRDQSSPRLSIYISAAEMPRTIEAFYSSS